LTVATETRERRPARRVTRASLLLRVIGVAPFSVLA
jgi:hypothetical protein